MRAFVPSLVAASFLCLASPALAQNADFNLTYHVERTPASQLSIDACGKAVAQAARTAGMTANVQTYPGQLVLVSGGTEGRGAFVVQCIAVEKMTVSVVQGIDYRKAKGALGNFADQAFAAVKAAID